MPEQMTSQVEATVEYLKRRSFANRKGIFWLCFCAGVLWILMQAKEVTSLLLLSYVLALLLDPLVTRLERFRLSRGLSIALIYFYVFVFIIALLTIAVPALLQEYNNFLEQLPNYLRTLAAWAESFLSRWPKLAGSLNPDSIWTEIRDYSAMIDAEKVSKIAATVGATVLSGYSITLTLLDLTLLPFFVYYLTSDLTQIHAFFGSFLPPQRRRSVADIGREVLSHIYAFFKGQLTVALILTVLYIVALLIIGLPSAIIVGIISGLLCIVPYLGVATGILISMTIMLVTDPSWWSAIKVLLVYTIIPGIESSFISPKIIGETLGIHPLAVMVALLIGGKLLGLLGLIIAIPCAAAARVLIRHALLELDRSGPRGDEKIVLSPDAAV
ncbi:MAG: AI-2E family transporter [Bdellovibrionota bacterium]